MDKLGNMAGIPHIYSPLLYIFEGELIRIGTFIKQIHYVSVLTGYGKLYGLYTHSRSAVVHVTTLKKLNQNQLQHALSSRLEATRNEYSLSLLGEWFAVQNLGTNISVRDLLKKKAYTLRENETYVCIVVEKLQTTFDFEDISNHTQAFFLAKGKTYNMDMKIVRRESPFRFDYDFTERISSAGYVGNSGVKCNGIENEGLRLNGLENVGTELKDMSKKSKPDVAPSDSKNPLDHDENRLPELQNESRNTESKDKLDEIKEDSAVVKATPVLPTDEVLTQAAFTEDKGNTIKNKDDVQTLDRGKKEMGFVPEEDSTRDDETWVEIKQSDLPTEEPPNDAMFTEAEIDNKEKADSLDGKQGETGFDSSVPETNSTIENEDNIACGVARELNENVNKESEGVKSEDSEVSNEESLAIEEDSAASTVLPEEERKVLGNEGSLREGQQEVNCIPAKNSTKEEKIETVDGHVAEKSQETENTRSKENKSDELKIANENILSTEESFNNTSAIEVTNKTSESEDATDKGQENTASSSVGSSDKDTESGNMKEIAHMNTDLEIELD